MTYARDLAKKAKTQHDRAKQLREIPRLASELHDAIAYAQVNKFDEARITLDDAKAILAALERAI